MENIHGSPPKKSGGGGEYTNPFCNLQLDENFSRHYLLLWVGEKYMYKAHSKPFYLFPYSQAPKVNITVGNKNSEDEIVFFTWD